MSSRIYVIGPVTGFPNENSAAFENVREVLSENGYVVDTPHDFIPNGTNWKNAMLVSIHRLTANATASTEPPKYIPLYDGVAMLDGWEDSKGAKIEKEVAEACGIKCLPWRDYINPAAPAAPYAHQSAAQPILAPAT